MGHFGMRIFTKRLTSFRFLSLSSIIVLCFFLHYFWWQNNSTDKLQNKIVGTLYKVDVAMGQVIQRGEYTWSINGALCDSVIEDDFILTHLQSPFQIPIYVYPINVDEFISYDLIHGGQYEYYNVEKILRCMKKYPKAVFLDLGAYVGSFSLTIASLGYKVIAVECQESNVRRMCASMKAADVGEKMTIVQNALTDRRGKVLLQTEVGNTGVTYITNNEKTGQAVYGITLDDLLEVFDFKQVVIKIDVFKHEHFVLRGALKFFNQVKVEAVLIEFVHHQADDYGNDGAFIVQFFKEHGLEPDLPDDIKWEYKKWKTAEIMFKRM